MSVKLVEKDIIFPAQLMKCVEVAAKNNLKTLNKQIYSLVLLQYIYLLLLHPFDWTPLLD